MPLTAVDRQLLQRCLRHEPGAWNDFVDRYLGLIYHVIQSTAHLRNMTLQQHDQDDLAAEIMSQLVANDYAAIRKFRGKSSLASYLSVIARRICVHELSAHAAVRQPPAASQKPVALANENPADGMQMMEEVQQLLGKLPPRERQVVRLFYVEGKTYQEISEELDITPNSIGPILSRAKQMLRGSE